MTSGVPGRTWLALTFLVCLFPGAAHTAVVAAPGEAQSDRTGLGRALESLSGSRMLADVARLSSPEFSGRQTATVDDLQSGLFVAERFHALGLEPAGTQLPGSLPIERAAAQPWFATEPVTAAQIMGTPRLELSLGAEVLPARLGSDYLPILYSPSVNVTAPVVFVGYGISDPARGFDEYEGLEVRNRIVLFLRGKPDRYPAPVTHADKERVAREKGAAAFCMVTGPILSAYESRRGLGTGPLAFYSEATGERQLPGCWISPALADKILATRGQTLREVQELLNRTLVPQSARTSVLAHLSWDMTHTPGTLLNVLGLLRGRDESAGSARGETVLIGAHRDHFGRQAGLLFPGADDNASGTAILLEVARVLSQSGLTPKRSILFASFSGEERGLLGSRLYVRRPARPLATTAAMLNVDHVGVGNGRLTVGISGLPKAAATEAGQLAGLADKLDLFGFFPGGDHVPFKEAGVPTVAIVSSGPHPDLHQTSDTAEKVQPQILELAARYVLALTWQLVNVP